MRIKIINFAGIVSVLHEKRVPHNHTECDKQSGIDVCQHSELWLLNCVPNYSLFGNGVCTISGCLFTLCTGARAWSLSDMGVTECIQC